LLAIPFVAPWFACRSHDQPQSWLSREGGGPLGQDVRAGKLEGLAHHVFNSQALGREVGLVVAVPASYAQQTEARFPVVYMFPGIGGDEWAYLAEGGRTGPTLEALFADPHDAPIVVFANPGSSGAHGAAERALSEELVAFVDRTYRTRAEASGRSLEGFSLGGVTALTMFLRHPETFGRVVAGSSACYLLSSCDALRAELRARAKPALAKRVLLSIGALEASKNAAVNDELARLFGIQVIRIPGADHNWSAQLETQLEGSAFGKRVADFHLAGFRK
jgi:enterochelin esterase-like enzyme